MQQVAWQKLTNAFGKQFENVFPEGEIIDLSKLGSDTVFHKEGRFIINEERRLTTLYTGEFDKIVVALRQELESNFMSIPDEKVRNKYLVLMYIALGRQIGENQEHINENNKEQPQEKTQEYLRNLVIELLSIQQSRLEGLKFYIQTNGLFKDALKEESHYRSSEVEKKLAGKGGGLKKDTFLLPDNLIKKLPQLYHTVEGILIEKQNPSFEENFVSIFSGGKTKFPIQVKNTRLLAYLLQQLNTKKIISYDWQSIAERGKMFKSKTGKSIKAADLARAVGDFNRVGNPTYHTIIDEALKPLKHSPKVS